MKKKIGFIVDASSDMSPELRNEYNVYYLGMLVTFGDESYATETEISNEEFYRRLKTDSQFPKSSHSSYQAIYDVFQKASSECETVIYFCLSSSASGQYQTAILVANEIKEDNPDADIRIVDSQNFSLFIAEPTLYAMELAKGGASADEIINAFLERKSSWDVFFLVEDLNHLQRGGRLNKAAAVVGTVLQIQPVLFVKNGIIDVCDKVRGKKNKSQKLIDLVKANPSFDSENPRFMISHTNPDYADDLKSALESEFGEGCVSLVAELGPVIGVHVGSNLIAVYYGIKKG